LDNDPKVRYEFIYVLTLRDESAAVGTHIPDILELEKCSLGIFFLRFQDFSAASALIKSFR